jgi:hypothetical protein
MWTELAAMLFSSVAAAFALRPSRGWVLWVAAGFLVASFLGAWGVGLIGVVAFLILRIVSGRYSGGLLLFLALITVALMGGSFWFRSGWGRWLGIAEAIEMALQTDGSGVGWGEWAYRQAEAQRAVLARFPLESWREIAPYFGVAPSLPFHLLAESGPSGFLFWVSAVTSSAFVVSCRERTVVRGAASFLFTFLLTSTVTTPVQFFLSVDRERVDRCDRALEEFRATPTRDIEALKVCPEIRTLEFSAATEGTVASYLLWHRTFPQDVMPAFALGRLAARSGNEAEALRWLAIAARGNPGNDGGARVLAEEAERIVSGDRSRLLLWGAKP